MTVSIIIPTLNEAVCIAALLTGKAKPSGRAVALISGGNIAPSTLAEYLAVP